MKFLAENGKATPQEITMNTKTSKSRFYEIINSLVESDWVLRNKISHKNVTYSLSPRGRMEYEINEIKMPDSHVNVEKGTISASWSSRKIEYTIGTSIPRTHDNWRENILMGSLLTQCALNVSKDLLASIYTIVDHPIPVLDVGEIDAAERQRFVDNILSAQFGLSVLVQQDSSRRVSSSRIDDGFDQITKLIEEQAISIEGIEQLVRPFVIAVLSRYQYRGFLLTSLQIERLVLHLLRSCMIPTLSGDITLLEEIVRSILRRMVKDGEVGELKGYFLKRQDMRDYQKLTKLSWDETQFQLNPERILHLETIEDFIKKSKDLQTGLLQKIEFKRDAINAIYNILAKHISREHNNPTREEMLIELPSAFALKYSLVTERIQRYFANAYSAKTHQEAIRLISSGKAPVFHVATDGRITVTETKIEDSELITLIRLFRDDSYGTVTKDGWTARD